MILNRDRFAILSNIWGQFRSLSLISPMTPDVGPGDDGFLWIDIGVDGTSETPLWKVWDEAANVWRQIGGGGSGGDGMTEAEHTAIGNASPHHAPVTLDADAGTLLGLSEQALGLDTQAANTVFTGPTSGAADTPAFRALAAADLPTHTHSKLVASDGSPDPALSADAAGVLTAAVSLKLATGATVTEFSTDGTLADNSDAATPTEKAVRTYVGGMQKAVALYQALPCLRAFYPMSAGYTGARDLGGGGHHLTAAGVPLFGYDGLVPYAEFDGTDDTFYYANNINFSILGTETSVVSTQRGLTLGAWIRPDAVNNSRGVICKLAAAGNQRSYVLYINTKAYLYISADGATQYNAESVANVNTTGWQLMIGRFVPNTTMDIYLDGVKRSISASGITTLKDSTAEFNIGSYENHTNGRFDGKISNAFVCACALSDSIIEAIWQQTRAMYGR